MYEKSLEMFHFRVLPVPGGGKGWSLPRPSETVRMERNEKTGPHEGEWEYTGWRLGRQNGNPGANHERFDLTRRAPILLCALAAVLEIINPLGPPEAIANSTKVEPTVAEFVNE